MNELVRDIFLKEYLEKGQEAPTTIGPTEDLVVISLNFFKVFIFAI